MLHLCAAKVSRAHASRARVTQRCCVFLLSHLSHTPSQGHSFSTHFPHFLSTKSNLHLLSRPSSSPQHPLLCWSIHFFGKKWDILHKMWDILRKKSDIFQKTRDIFWKKSDILRKKWAKNAPTKAHVWHNFPHSERQIHNIC